MTPTEVAQNAAAARVVGVDMSGLPDTDNVKSSFVHDPYAGRQGKSSAADDTSADDAPTRTSSRSDEGARTPSSASSSGGVSPTESATEPLQAFPNAFPAARRGVDLGAGAADPALVKFAQEQFAGLQLSGGKASPHATGVSSSDMPLLGTFSSPTENPNAAGFRHDPYAGVRGGKPQQPPASMVSGESNDTMQARGVGQSFSSARGSEDSFPRVKAEEGGGIAFPMAAPNAGGYNAAMMQRADPSIAEHARQMMRAAHGQEHGQTSINGSVNFTNDGPPLLDTFTKTDPTAGISPSQSPSGSFSAGVTQMQGMQQSSPHSSQSNLMSPTNVHVPVQQPMQLPSQVSGVPNKPQVDMAAMMNLMHMQGMAPQAVQQMMQQMNYGQQMMLNNMMGQQPQQPQAQQQPMAQMPVSGMMQGMQGQFVNGQQPGQQAAAQQPPQQQQQQQHFVPQPTQPAAQQLQQVQPQQPFAAPSVTAPVTAEELSGTVTKQVQKSASERFGAKWSARLQLEGVAKGSPAEKADLRRFKGMTLTHIDMLRVTTAQTVSELLDGGDTFTLRFQSPAASPKVKDKKADAQTSIRVPPAPPLPTEISALPPGQDMPTVATLQFKYGRKAAFATNRSVEEMQQLRSTSPYWIVEAAKGIDLGMLTGEAQPNPKEKPTTGQTLYRIVRPATPEEVAIFETEMPAEDAKALEFVQEKARKGKSVVTIHRCEFQFDKLKLTVHYSSSVVRPDFRQLCHYAFREFKCRIWMNNCQPLAGQPGDVLALDGPTLPKPIVTGSI